MAARRDPRGLSRASTASRIRATLTRSRRGAGWLLAVTTAATLGGRWSMADAGPAATRPGRDSTACDQAVMRVPIDGHTQKTYGAALGDGFAVYARSTPGLPPASRPLRLFDTNTCQARILASGAYASNPFVHGHEIIWDDLRNLSQPAPFHCSDLYRQSIDHPGAMRLTRDPRCELGPRTNGRFDLFRRHIRPEIRAPSALVLRERATNREIELAPAAARVEAYDISDRYVVWAAHTGAAGRDLLYRDLHTGQSGRIEGKASAHRVQAAGSYITWTESDRPPGPPYRLWVRHMPSGRQHLLAHHDASVSRGVIDGDLVAWNTAPYSGQPARRRPPSHIRLHDLRTGVTRDLTRTPDTLRIVRMRFPWLLLVRQVNPASRLMNDYFIVHLGRLGIFSATGHLLAGHGVMVPP